jgi:RND family efflux transporter MFP subunit
MTSKKWVIAMAVLLGGGLLLWCWIGRTSTEANFHNYPIITTAPLTLAKRRDLGDTLTVSGAFKPFQDIDVHAKVAGYIRKIYVDVGDHVKARQTLAVLEVPELAAELAGAHAAVRAAQEKIRGVQGDLDRAQSTHSAAHSAYIRLKQAADSQAGLVAQQEVDDSQAKDLGTEAQVATSEAELSAAKQQLEVARATQKQYTALLEYTQITAPFAGVVTVRYADTGSLIAAGTTTSTQSMPVVRLAQISVLRLVLQIPESLAPQIHVGGMMKVHVQALNQDYEGRVSRFADSLDQQTRTMETELDFQNSGGKLMPGMFCEAYFIHNKKKNVLTIPIEAVNRNGDETTVFVVDAQNIVRARTVKLGQEGTTDIEVLSGLTEGERVILGILSEFTPGQRVLPKMVDSGSEAKAEEQLMPKFALCTTPFHEDGGGGRLNPACQWTAE